jgi:phenylacetate-CoA oxygenase PaaI subunit
MMPSPEPELSKEPSSDVLPLVRDLILVLADSKRILGMRYAGWILGAPELEAGIACASMAQDEWGHGRLLYALLKEFDEDVDALEHGREASNYCNLEVLDAAPEDWAGLVAINVFVDGALAVQLDALRESSWAPARLRVAKMLDEEKFHAAHGAAWFRRLARGGYATRESLTRATDAALPVVLRWFGPDSDRAHRLANDSVIDASASQLRQRFVARVAPLLGEIDRDADSIALDFTQFDETSRRGSPGGPDARTIEQVRGDRNRAFLMD